ncbi:MAG: tyrosine-type recombinase/integrase [Phycisphaerales bacterium]
MPGNVNPAKDVERYKEKQQPIRYLTLEQIDEQLHALRFAPQLQTMVAMLIYAGVRRGELLWLTNDDVDLAAGRHGMLRIRPKEHTGETWHGKTPGSIRAIPISSQLRSYLDRYAPRPSDGPGRGWYFPSPDGKRWEEDNFSGRYLYEANSAARLVWTCLDYRHTFGSQLAQKGVSLFKISQLMGNSPEICRRHYAALVPETMSDEVQFPICITHNLQAVHA